jgi:YggT family protein
VKPIEILIWFVLQPLLGLGILAFLFRFILTWFPQKDLNQLPYNLIAWPTEPFLRPTRKLIPSFGGVDITPFIWLAILAFVREILLGQQGILTMFTRLKS